METKSIWTSQILLDTFNIFASYAELSGAATLVSGGRSTSKEKTSAAKLNHYTAHSRLIRITPVPFDKADVTIAIPVRVCIDSLEATMHSDIEELQSAATFISSLRSASIANVIRISGKIRELSCANWTSVFGFSQLILLGA
jgi:hypothetical protein